MPETYRFKSTVSPYVSGVVLTEDMVRDIAAAVCPKDVKDCDGDAVIGLDFFLSQNKRHSQLIPFTDDESKEDKILFSLAYFPGLRTEPVTQLQWDKEALKAWWEEYGSCESTRDAPTRSIPYPSYAFQPEWMMDELIKAAPYLKNYQKLLLRVAEKPGPQSKDTFK